MDDKLRQKRNKYTGFMMKSDKVRKGFEDSWYIHCRMFGDIMEPAFKDDIASRMELTAALNFISRGEISKGVKKLGKLFAFCETDADFAAFYFFMGVCYERIGMGMNAGVFFAESAKREPEFYMVYLMLAKCLHEEKRYEEALGAYIRTLEVIEESPKKYEVPAVREEPLLGSVHGNMANCLVMMRRYDEAEYELYESARYNYEPPMINLTWAALYAATDRKQLAREKMSRLRSSLPELESATVLMIQEILEQKNPRFYLKPIDQKRLTEFWAWFEENELQLRRPGKETASAELLKELQERLCGLFDCADAPEQPRFALSSEGKKTALSFFDNYNLTFEIWLGRLVDTAPRSLKENWSFYSVH